MLTDFQNSFTDKLKINF